MTKKTKQKEVILRILQHTRAHPTADRIYEEARKEIPNISKATVYRNLKVLQESRVVSELNLKGTLTRFEIKQPNHYHFRCEQCGTVLDIDVPFDKKLDQKIADRTGLKIHHHQLEFRGICRDCQHKNKPQEE